MTPEQKQTYRYLKVYGVPALEGNVENSSEEVILTPQACRLVATGALLLYSWHYPLKRLLPLKEEETKKLRRMLENAWGITSARAACQEMDALYDVGHRATLQPQWAQNEAEWRAKFNEHPFLRARPVTSVAAWDYGRIASVAYWSLVAGFIEENTAFRYMDKATRASIERFNSWEEFAVSYLAGRCMWNPDDSEGLEELIERVEWRLKFEVSAWCSSPWADYTPWQR